MSAVISPAAPFKGLEPFSEKDAPFFFGREEMSEIVSANLMSSRLTVIYGPSGVGKSSLLRAGVVHHLKRAARANASRNGDPGFAIAILDKWRDDPLSSLIAAAREALTQANGDVDFTPSPASSSIVESIREMTENAESDLLLILDQFEEYFLYHSDETGEGTFATEFARLVTSPGLRVNALIAIRDDSYTKLDLFKDYLFNLFDCSIAIRRLDRDEARDAIIKPIDQYNCFFTTGRQEVEPELVEEVLNQVKAGRDLWNENERKQSPGTAQETLIEATYLQLVMNRLWREETTSGSARLRLETFERLGGAESIVRDHLLSVLNGMSEDERNAAERLFYHLVTPSRTKIAYPVYDLVEMEEMDRGTLDSVLKALSEGKRILRPVRSPVGESAALYEIFHDVLAKPILEWSRGREVEAQKQLAEDAKRKAEKQKRIARNMKLLAIAAAILFMLSVILGVMAYVKKVEAEKNAEFIRKELADRAEVDYFNTRAFSLLYGSEGWAAPEIIEALEAELESYRRSDNKIGIGMSLHHLGRIYQRIGDGAVVSGAIEPARDVEKDFRDSLAVLREVMDPKHPYLANVLNDFGAFYYAQAKFRDSAPLLREALEIRRQSAGIDKRYLIDSIDNLATNYAALGEYVKAGELYEEELEAVRKFDPGDREAIVKKDLGQTYFEQKRFQEAEPLLEEALRVARKSLDVPGSEVTVLSLLRTLAQVYRELHKDAEADSLYKEALGIKIDYRTSHLDSGYYYLHLGMLHSDQGKYIEAKGYSKEAQKVYVEAERCLSEAQKVLDTYSGSDYFNGFFARIKLAEIYEKQNRFGEAETLYKDALKIQQDSLGEDNRLLAGTLESCAALLQRMNERDETAPLQKMNERDEAPQLRKTNPKDEVARLRKANRRDEAARLESQAKQIRSKQPDSNQK